MGPTTTATSSTTAISADDADATWKAAGTSGSDPTQGTALGDRIIALDADGDGLEDLLFSSQQERRWYWWGGENL